MGFLLYGQLRVDFEDRVLAHLQVVIVNKLRRRENFSMSWRESGENGDGRGALWIDPSVPLYFRFDGSRSPQIDREWVERLAASSVSTKGLIVTDEKGEPVLGLTHLPPLP